MNVIPLFRPSQAKANGTGVVTALMATRYGLSAAQATRMAVEARTLVERGHSPAHARTAMLKRIQRQSAGRVA